MDDTYTLPIDLFAMEDRGDGVHVSSIIHDLCVSMERYKPAPANPQRLELGCALEYAIAAACDKQHPGRFEHNLELNHDGLYGTPDLIDLVSREIWEVKVTWYSLRDKGCDKDMYHDNFWAYWVQVMAYCYMLSVDTGVLIIYFVNGRYEKHVLGDTKRCVWLRTFTDEQLEQNWTMLTNHGQRMGVL